jgi:hypothetical protein
MSDAIEDDTTLENRPNFEHYVQATYEIAVEFRDVLAAHIAKLHQEAIDRGGQNSPDHIQEAAELHRLRIGCDNFLNVLAGNY